MPILPYSPKLNIARLQRLFDNKSECYKLFWFQALVDEVSAGRTVISYDDLINDMIAAAWYMVTEYRLNLGPSDNLEALVHYAHQEFGINSCEKKEKIIELISSSEDQNIRRVKNTLAQNVPYRLQAPFMPQMKGTEWDGPKLKVAEKINAYEGNIYRINIASGLSSTVTVDEDWAEYICTNREIIRGWIKYNMIEYLQRRNPSVPGILNKLSPPDERKLTLVTKLWSGIRELCPLEDIYGDNPLEDISLSIDHFVPWSYVAHDELWNLSPTTKSINSSKSNNLPAWDLYFEKLCSLQFRAYSTARGAEQLNVLFNRCLEEHVNNHDIRHRLFDESLTLPQFSRNLEDIMLPVYKGAESLGFEQWRLS